MQIWEDAPSLSIYTSLKFTNMVRLIEKVEKKVRSVSDLLNPVQIIAWLILDSSSVFVRSTTIIEQPTLPPRFSSAPKSEMLEML